MHDDIDLITNIRGCGITVNKATLRQRPNNMLTDKDRSTHVTKVPFSQNDFDISIVAKFNKSNMEIVFYDI